MINPYKRAIEIEQNEGGIAILNIPGLFGPIAFSEPSNCGNVKNGISISHTFRLGQDIHFAGGVFSLEDGIRLQKWLKKVIWKRRVEKIKKIFR